MGINKEDKEDRLKVSMIPTGVASPTRYHLNDTRSSRTVGFKIWAATGNQDKNGFNEVKEVKGYFIVGMYDDGSPGELYIHLGKEGDDVHGWANAWSKAISMLLQFGISHQYIYDKFKYLEFFPKGITNMKSSPICKSIIDLIMKYMESNFPPTSKLNEDNEYGAVIESIIVEDNEYGVVVESAITNKKDDD